MARVREEARRHGTREGMLRALAATGPVITSAGVILAGTFSVLMTLPVSFTFDLGFMVAFGILLDTFVVRTIMELIRFCREEATHKMWEAHHCGRSLLLLTYRERAELYVEQFASRGLEVTIEPAG